MREIKLSDAKDLRGTVVQATIDDENVEFINGVAVVEANIVTKDDKGKTTNYNCFGLIDHLFCEAFGSSSREDASSRNLMFLRSNQKIYRVGNDDFLVTFYDRDEDENKINVKYRHVRIVNGNTILVNEEMKYPVKTSCDNLFIFKGMIESCLYNVSRGEYVSSTFFRLNESKNEPGVFNVIERISLSKGGLRMGMVGFDLVDYLTFKIDSEGNLVSGVLSSLDNGLLSIDENVSIEQVIKDRREELVIREACLYKNFREFRKNYSNLKKGTAMQMLPKHDN